MLRNRYAPVDLFALVPALELRFEPELAELWVIVAAATAMALGTSIGGWRIIRTDRSAPSILGALEQCVPLIHQVCAQTERRIFQGEVVPAADKVASLFEPHTAIIRRGKVRHPAEFGRKLLLDEVDGGLVSRYVLLPGNPPDAEHLLASVVHHRAQFGQPPAVLTADRAFFTFDN